MFGMKERDARHPKQQPPTKRPTPHRPNPTPQPEPPHLQAPRARLVEPGILLLPPPLGGKRGRVRHLGADGVEYRQQHALKDAAPEGL
jgi:hypothetical protein